MLVDISNGELVDKVTILAIKLQRMRSPEKLANVRKEYDALRRAMHAAGISESMTEYGELVEVNTELWEIEDAIRRKEAAQRFDEEFVQLARSVYLANDRRAHIKRRINDRTGSALREEKEYVEYSQSSD